MPLFDALNQFYFNMTISDLQSVNKQLLGSNISYHSLLYMDLIGYRENCTVSDLAKVLGVSLPAVTSKVGELIRQGHVIKTQSEKDRRVYYLTLNDRAKEYFANFDRRMLRAIQLAQKNYTPEQLACCGEILCEISKQYMEAHNNE